MTSLSSSGQLLVREVLFQIKLDSEHAFIETTRAEIHRLMKRALAVCVWLAVPLWLAGCKHFQSVPLAAEPAAAAFDARSLDDPGLANFLAHNQLPPEVPWHPPAKWNLPTLTLVAFYFHPNLEVARAQWSVAKAGIRTAGGRLNPVLSLVPGYDFTGGSGLSPWIPAVSYDLPIETAGKRGRRIERARNLSEFARLNIATVAWQVRASLRASLLAFTAADRRVGLLQSQLQVQQQIVGLLEQRLAAGAASTTEVTAARLALIKTATDLNEARRLRIEARGLVAASLGLPAKAIDGVEFDYDWSPAPAPAAEPTSLELRRQALQSRPDILAALAEYAATQSALQFEIARQYPDIHLGAGYQFDQGDSKWSLSITAELPVLNRNQGPIAEAEARRAEAAARFIALQGRVIGEIDRALALRAATEAQLRESETLLQTQRKQLEAQQAAFAAGAADQLELQHARLETRVSELTLLDAQGRAQQAIGQLEEALQRPFESLSVIERETGAQVRKDKP